VLNTVHIDHTLCGMLAEQNRRRLMKTRILFKVTSIQYFDTGHEVDSLAHLAGCTIVAVEDRGDDAVVLTVDDSPQKIAESAITPHNKRKPKRSKRSTGRTASAVR